MNLYHRNLYTADPVRAQVSQFATTVASSYGR